MKNFKILSGVMIAVLFAVCCKQTPNPDQARPVNSINSLMTIPAGSGTFKWIDTVNGREITITARDTTYTVSTSVTTKKLDTAWRQLGTVTPPPPPSDTTTTPPVTTMAIQGFGVDAVGGSLFPNAVYHVTNLNASGPGSLNNGIGSNKNIVFDVSGVINARHDVNNVSYLTIDGTTAPYPGVSITTQVTKNGDGMSIGTGSHHIIVAGLTLFNCYNDGLNVVDNAHDVAITNCTAYGNGDGNIDIGATKGKNVTMQLCIIGSHIHPSWNDGAGGSLVTTTGNISVHHCFFNLKSPAEGERAPLVHNNYSTVGSPSADIRYNVVTNWGRSNATGSGFGIGVLYGATANIVNNYLKTSSSATADGISLDAYGLPKGFAYIAGNVSGNGVNYNTKSNKSEYVIDAKYRIAVQTVKQATDFVMQNAGITQRLNGKRKPEDQAFIDGVTITGL